MLVSEYRPVVNTDFFPFFLLVSRARISFILHHPTLRNFKGRILNGHLIGGWKA
jgi:hypothetical protein